MKKWTKKLGHTLSRFVTSKPPFTFPKPRSRPTVPPPPPPPPSPPVSIPPPAMPHGGRRPTPPGGPVFPRATSTVLPDPARFFAAGLLKTPLPTNTFFQNYVLNNGDQPEYIHPYSIRSAGGDLTVCYPTRNHSPSFIIQTFVEDLIISSPSDAGGGTHRVAAFDDLSVTLDVSPSLRAHLVRGCPYATVATAQGAGAVDISVASVHAFVEVAPCDQYGTKWRLRMNSGQTFLLYASAPIRLAQTDTSQLSAKAFAGVIRVAFLPDAYMEPVLDRYSGCYPTAGEAALNQPFCLEYHWRKAGPGELLMLAHPLHLRLLSHDCSVRVLDDFRYRSIDGDLVGVVGDSWVLRTDPVSPTWHSTHGVSDNGVDEVVAALRKDVDGLASTPITTTSSYFYGKAIARAARFAMIAEEVGCPEVIPAVQRYLKAAVTPWLDGSFQGNGFLYESRWGGLVTRQGLQDTGADFGFGIYNDHHYHLGYFLYAIAVLAKIDPCWGRKYMPQAYSMVADFMTLSRKPGASFTRLRMFDLWKLHSWAGGLTEFADGRNQESTSEAVNAYYSAALVGLSARRDADRVRGAGGAGVVARPGGGRHVRGRLQRQQPRGGRSVGEQARQRALVRTAGVEGVPAGDPAAAVAARQRGAVPGRGVREGASELDGAGAGEGRRRGRVEGVRVRAGGRLRQGGGAEQDAGADGPRRRQLAQQPAVVAPQPPRRGRRWQCRYRPLLLVPPVLPLRSRSPWRSGFGDEAIDNTELLFFVVLDFHLRHDVVMLHFYAVLV